MKPVRIELIRKIEHPDLIEQYELFQENPCPFQEGDQWTSFDSGKPEGLCTHAWSSLYPYVFALANGATGLFSPWMKDTKTALVSCPDGFRPASFLLTCLDE